MSSITGTRRVRRGKQSFMGEIKVKGVTRVSLLRRQGFNKREIWDFEDQRVDL